MSKKGTAEFYNGWGCTLLEVHIRHRRGNDPNREDSASFYCVPANKTVQMDVIYESFSLSDDYWWIKFVTFSGMEYQPSENILISNITIADNGTVTIRVDSDTQCIYIVQSFTPGIWCPLQNSRG